MMLKGWRLPFLICMAIIFDITNSAHGEQKVEFEDWEVHYSVFNSMFLTPEVAEKYGITRARDRAVITISVLDPESKSVAVELTGSYKNQLSQEYKLKFKKIDENAVYFVATLRFTDREILRFNVVAALPQGNREMSFQQKMYVDR